MCSRILALATQLSATPPVMQRSRVAMLLQQPAHQMQHDFFRHGLQRESHIAMPVGERLAGRRGGPNAAMNLRLNGRSWPKAS